VRKERLNGAYVHWHPAQNGTRANAEKYAAKGIMFICQNFSRGCKTSGTERGRAEPSGENPDAATLDGCYKSAKYPVYEQMGAEERRGRRLKC